MKAGVESRIMPAVKAEKLLAVFLTRMKRVSVVREVIMTENIIGMSRSCEFIYDQNLAIDDERNRG